LYNFDFCVTEISVHMAKTSAAPSREILEAALHGLEGQRQKLDEQIAQVRSLLGRRVGRPPKSNGSEAATAASGAAAPKKRRGLSAEARKRIAAAQKKRWAAFRKTQG
jgi:hypothetical protein